MSQQEDYDDHLATLLDSSFEEENCTIGEELTSSAFLVPNDYNKYASLLPVDEIVQKKIDNILGKVSSSKKALSELNICKLYACRTSGDGDCLLHAISLSLWGQDDKNKVLRQILAITLTSEFSNKLKELWKESEKINDSKMGFPRSRTNKQLDDDFSLVVEEASESGAHLESMHISCLAHILRIPIIVYADEYLKTDSGENISTQLMGGIYLPVLHAPNSCHRRPLLIAYSCHLHKKAGPQGHFAAILMEETNSAFVPLVDPTGNALPLRYANLPSANHRHREFNDEELLRSYLDIEILLVSPSADNPSPSPITLVRTLWPSDQDINNHTTTTTTSVLTSPVLMDKNSHYEFNNKDPTLSPITRRLEMGSQVRRARYAFLGRTIAAMKDEQQRLEMELQDLQERRRRATDAMSLELSMIRRQKRKEDMIYTPVGGGNNNTHRLTSNNNNNNNNNNTNNNASLSNGSSNSRTPPIAVNKYNSTGFHNSNKLQQQQSPVLARPVSDSYSNYSLSRHNSFQTSFPISDSSTTTYRIEQQQQLQQQQLQPQLQQLPVSTRLSNVSSPSSSANSSTYSLLQKTPQGNVTTQPSGVGEDSPHTIYDSNHANVVKRLSNNEIEINEDQMYGLEDELEYHDNVKMKYHQFVNEKQSTSSQPIVISQQDRDGGSNDSPFRKSTSGWAQTQTQRPSTVQYGTTATATATSTTSSTAGTGAIIDTSTGNDSPSTTTSKKEVKRPLSASAIPSYLRHDSVLARGNTGSVSTPFRNNIDTITPPSQQSAPRFHGGVTSGGREETKDLSQSFNTSTIATTAPLGRNNAIQSDPYYNNNTSTTTSQRDQYDKLSSLHAIKKNYDLGWQEHSHLLYDDNLPRGERYSKGVSQTSEQENMSSRHIPLSVSTTSNAPLQSEALSPSVETGGYHRGTTAAAYETQRQYTMTTNFHNSNNNSNHLSRENVERFSSQTQAQATSQQPSPVKSKKPEVDHDNDNISHAPSNLSKPFSIGPFSDTSDISSLTGTMAGTSIGGATSLHSFRLLPYEDREKQIERKRYQNKMNQQNANNITTDFNNTPYTSSSAYYRIQQQQQQREERERRINDRASELFDNYDNDDYSQPFVNKNTISENIGRSSMSVTSSSSHSQSHRENDNRYDIAPTTAYRSPVAVLKGSDSRMRLSQSSGDRDRDRDRDSYAWSGSSIGGGGGDKFRSTTSITKESAIPWNSSEYTTPMTSLSYLQRGLYPSSPSNINNQKNISTSLSSPSNYPTPTNRPDSATSTRQKSETPHYSNRTSMEFNSKLKSPPPQVTESVSAKRSGSVPPRSRAFNTTSTQQKSWK